jgi:hypothetical protein
LFNARRYWGKAGKSGGHHLLCYHSLDVAAVGVALLRQSPSLQQLLRKALPDCTSEALEGWLIFFLALHDLGKFSEAFQSQRADLMQLPAAVRQTPASRIRCVTIRSAGCSGSSGWKSRRLTRSGSGWIAVIWWRLVGWTGG